MGEESEAGTSATTSCSMGHPESFGRGGEGEVCVIRPALTVTQRCHAFHYDAGQQPGLGERAKNYILDKCSVSCEGVGRAVTARLPILSWLPSYSPKASLMGDVIAGVTVAIMHIPQGMAYALLASVPPITGIYMAFFPVLIYAFLGTSRHCSMGTFAVVCLMTGKVVGEVATLDSVQYDAAAANGTTLDSPGDAAYTPNQVAAIVAFMVGAWELVLGLLQLGSLSVFLSDMLVSGFTTGAAVHVLTSQVKYLFGLKIPRYNGPLKIIYTYRDIVQQLLRSNPAAMVASIITIGAITFNNEVIKPRLRKRTQIPLPIELLAVILGTLASYLGNFSEIYDVQIVGEIPTGLPEPTVPPLELMPRVLVDSFIITIVSYTVSFSMAKIFAKKHNYSVDAAQELYSQSASNIFGSFFGCAPIAASLSRSLIQEAVGGVTQITSLISCGLLVLVLLFIGPVFEKLPNCVLSSIIVVALKGMFLQVNDLKQVWAISKVDASIWIASFLSVVVIDIDYGLMVGVLVSLLVLLLRGQKPQTAVLGHVPNTDIYLDIKKYASAVEVPSMCIFQFSGPLHFANAEYFKAQLFARSGLDPTAIQTIKNTLRKRDSDLDMNSTVCKENGIQEGSEGHHDKESKGEGDKTHDDSHHHKSSTNLAEKQLNGVSRFLKVRLGGRKKEVMLSLPEVKWLVVDMGGVSYVDSTGGKLLSQLAKDYKDADITLLLAAVSEGVLQSLERCGTLKTIPGEQVFHAIHDAVTTLANADHPPPAGTCTKL